MEPGYAVPFLKRQEGRRELSRALSREILERLRAASAEAAELYPSIMRVTVFGSVAQERATASSDVDVLVEGMPTDGYFALRRLLSERLEREVDLHTETEPAAFVGKIRTRGRGVYERHH